MTNEKLSLSEIRKRFPDEWVLIGDPVMDDNHLDVLSGVPVYHSKDKRELCYLGRSHTSSFSKITLLFTGDLPPASRKITGIFNRVSE